MSKLAKTLQAAAGNAGGDNLYVEDVFSTYLYTGNGSTQTITNGIDLAGEGGLVWQKVRSSAGYRHFLFDTERAFNNYISSNTTDAQSSLAALSSFNSDGVTLTSDGNVNGSGINSVLWTFRKAPKFFDVVTYTGNGVAGRTVAHNLGSVPGCILFKRTDGGSTNWRVYHRSLGATKTLKLNTTDTEQVFSSVLNDTDPTSTVFTVGSFGDVNGSGSTYAAYLFAHNAGGFGEEEDQNIISCGSYTGNNAQNIVNVGFEPQFFMVKPATTSGNWSIIDNMRSFVARNPSNLGSFPLRANLANAEFTDPNNYGVNIYYDVNGVDMQGSASDVNTSGDTYIYIAIRRGPMKTPESGTEVFAAYKNTSGTSEPTYISGFPVDFAINRSTLTSSDNNIVGTRLLQGSYLITNSTDAEGSSSSYQFDYNNGWRPTSSTNAFSWMFRRAPGFFDVVGYAGTGVTRTVAHNLGVAPEMMIIKDRTSPYYDWKCYNSTIGPTKYLTPNSTGGAATQVPTVNKWNDTAPTATVFSVGTNATLNGSGDNYIAYLFATLAGVSKVGSYTGTGSNVDVDCGFSAGARFILIKRTDSSGDWYVWDSARGIVAGNDPYLLLNNTAAEVTSTDYIDPLSSGFTVTSSAPAALNASGGSYIFLAIS